MKRIAFIDRALAARLGLGNLTSRVPCHGYANGCVCGACNQISRAIAANGFTPDGKIASPRHPRQPWDNAA